MSTNDTSIQPGVDDHLGLCPECVASGDYATAPIMLNLHKTHFATCEKHGKYWRIGRNLFSGWQYESEAQWQANADTLERMQRVEPRFLPSTEREIELETKGYVEHMNNEAVLEHRAGRLKTIGRELLALGDELEAKLSPSYRAVMQSVYPGDDCPRCGVNAQATHHPACEARDGTPTNLTDDEVRAAIQLETQQREYLADLLGRMNESERRQLLEFARELCDAEPFDCGGTA